MEVAAGEIILADHNNDLHERGVVGYGRRETSSSATTTEVGVLRVDNRPIKAGHAYEVKVDTSAIWGSTVAGDLIEGRLRYAEGGAAATTSSTRCGLRADNSRTASGSQFTNGVIGRFTAAATGVVSTLFSVSRTAGTGSVSIPASATYPVEMTIIDLGPAASNTGVAI